MKKLIREPLLHFALLGSAVFALNAWRQGNAPLQQASPATIEVSAQVVERLRAGYERQFNRAPDNTELRDLITAHIREEGLFREAMALGLDQDDTIVRRRLAQKMEFLTDDLVGAAGADEVSLQQFLDRHAARYARPARVSFRHVYFSEAKRGLGAQDAAAEAKAALQKGGCEDLFGDPFLHGYEFAGREPVELDALFGAGFAAQLAKGGEREWNGPIASSYGLHLYHIESREAPRAVTLQEVRTEVLRDYNDEKRRTANREIFERLRGRYEIIVDEEAVMKAAAAGHKAVQR